MAEISLSTPLDTRLIEQHLPAGEALAVFNAAYPGAGAVVSFLGNVRPDDTVEALELTHYELLTLPGIESLAQQALDRFALTGVLAWHRVGVMVPGDPIVLVAAAARHRRDAFAGAEFLMDHLKSASWLWKREKRADGWHWIEPRAVDHGDRARWE
ncbi:molybdenum cofactor biosynthesis protein MoaE [Erythrobacter sp.]|uniref:molybdenum cofactor biosynthesis protein MoaE n=1 Tax=Erythrobacter sp. TaxID=1042 RepID=UPI00311EE388